MLRVIGQSWAEGRRLGVLKGQGPSEALAHSPGVEPQPFLPESREVDLENPWKGPLGEERGRSRGH